MVTIIITAALLLLVGLAFKLFWKDVLYFAAQSVVYTADVLDKFIVFIRRNAKAVAYIIKHYRDGKTGRIATEEEIDIELCPDEVQDALNEGKTVRVHNIG